MWEVCISEFHIKHFEFLFEFSPQQIFLLIQKRSERMDKSKKGQDNPASAKNEGTGISPFDMRVLGSVFNG